LLLSAKRSPRNKSLSGHPCRILHPQRDG
jgi:hypothetical protein